MSSLTRDLFRSLPPSCRLPHRLEEEVGETEEDVEVMENGVELSLGLSLNGRFGVDPGKAESKLNRSSSIPDFLSPSPASVAFSASIIRTFSLPAETEEESRKRWEVQSLRRLDAKRKRVEKSSCGLLQDCRNSVTEDCQNNVVHVKPRSLSQQGSVGSQGSGTGSSGISSDSDIQQQFQEMAPKSPAAQRLTGPKGAITTNGHGLPPKGGTGTRKIVSEVMPYVFTKGDGPDGKRVEGFLYQYRKGEEVTIVCVCHGSFFSPAEFVRHAGGGDVANPMRHIVVMPSSLM